MAQKRNIQQRDNEDEEMARLQLIIQNVTSPPIMLNILKQSKPRVALNLAIATSNNKRYVQLHQAMQSEELWMSWFKRDLWWQIKDTRAFGGTDRIPEWIVAIGGIRNNDEGSFWNVAEAYGDIFIDRPVWKVIYLWYALNVALIQYNTVDDLNEFIDLGHSYDEDVQVQHFLKQGVTTTTFLELNSVKVTFKEGEERIMTFDTFFKTYDVSTMSSDSPVTYSYLYSTARFLRIPLGSYMRDILPSFHLMDSIDTVASAFSVLFTHNASSPRDILTRFPYAFPKSEKLPIVACSMCNSQNAQFMCGSCQSAYYCNRGCQRQHFKEHTLKCKN